MASFRLLLLAGGAATAAALSVAARRSLVSWLPAEARRLAVDWRQRQREVALRTTRRPLRLLLVRHGQSEANTRLGTVGGRDVQSPLSAKGEEQARHLGARLRREGLKVDRIIASHAVRAERTAEIACGVLGVDTSRIEIEPRVVEVCPS